METWKRLRVWREAHHLVLEIYKSTKLFPKEELYGLVSQVRRAAVSIAANVVESTKRKTDKDKAHFFTIAEGSLEEVKYFIYLSHELGYISLEDGERLTLQAEEVGKMLHGFNNALRKA